jgi:micrococcal nuclease
VFGVVAIISSLFSRDNPTPTEKAEGRKGVEQVEKQQAKQPKQKQEIEKEESGAGAEPPPSPADEESSGDGSSPTVKIARVVDGDTIEISPAVDGKDTVRLIGIDAPEEEESASCGAQPLAREAADVMETWKGSRVKLEFDEDRTDRYGRLLAYVEPQGFVDDVMLNEEMVLAGLAQVYIVPPNTKYEDRLRKAQQEAKKNPPLFDTTIWTLSASKQDQLADRGNGLGQGDGACPSREEPKQQSTATPTASPDPSPNPSPNRNKNAHDPNAPDPNAPVTAPSTASPAAGGSDCEPPAYRVPPGDPRDGDDDGCAGEE